MHIKPFLKNMRQTTSGLGYAGVAMVKSGILRPLNPAQLWSIASQAHQIGRSIATLAMVSATRFPATPAVIDEKGSITFAQLDQRVVQIAAVMSSDYQISTGDTVAIMCRNHRGFVQAFLAAMRLGAHVVLLNTDFPGPQLTQVLARHQLKLLVHDQEFEQHIKQADYAGAALLAWTESASHPTSLDGLIAPINYSFPRVKQAGQIILLTSGTTGTPKGAPRTSEPLSFVGTIITFLAKIPFKTQAPIYIGPPLFHGFGLAFLAASIIMGSPMLLQRRFNPAKALQLIEQHQVKTLVAVPVMLQRMLDSECSKDFNLSSLSTVLAAAAPLSAALAQRWMARYGHNLYNLYGSTEVGLVSMATPQDLTLAAGTVGLPPLGTKLKIFNSQGQPLPCNETGHICVKSPMLFKGYVGGGNKSNFDGFMNTGDVGHIDVTGHLFIDGREDDMIISGGENVFPQEIEELLAKHPSVADVAVIGVADEEFGQRLKAFVVCHDAQQENEEALKSFIKINVARYKMPREIVFLPELPRNITGKVLKKSLAAL